VKRDEFASLPVSIALGLIYDMARAKLEPMPRPAVPMAPKFDGRLPRKGGFFWLSEMLLQDLEWWHSKKQESAASGGEWAEKDGKLAATLAKWIEWRKLFPSERWRGKRGDDWATAEAPSREPQLRQWDPKGSPKGNGAKAPQGSSRRGPERPPEDEGDGYGF